MANKDQLDVIKSGVSYWNSWRSANSDETVDLSGANLGGMDLRSANFRHTHFLSHDYFDVDEAGRPVRTADFGANLSKVDLSGADLSGANFNLADLRGANLNGAKINGAEFSRAWFHRTVLTDLDLSAASGLDSILHFGPSSIGIDSIYKSGGNISEALLRGIGVPDSFIAYVRSLTGRPIEFYSCFISYSSQDQQFAERLYADLQNKGVRCWFAPHHIAGGQKLHQQIDEAIRVYDRLLLILSEESMKSPWVETEVSKARKREVREGRRMLFPVRLTSFETLRDWACFDADTGKDSAREIREYFIPDFSLWRDNDTYQEAFQRLLRDLKTD
jgi:uncharacterized protein YjbI with pentapeptide repeats